MRKGSPEAARALTPLSTASSRSDHPFSASRVTASHTKRRKVTAFTQCWLMDAVKRDPAANGERKIPPKATNRKDSPRKFPWQAILRYPTVALSMARLAWQASVATNSTMVASVIMRVYPFFVERHSVPSQKSTVAVVLAIDDSRADQSIRQVALPSSM